MLGSQLFIIGYLQASHNWIHIVLIYHHKLEAFNPYATLGNKSPQYRFTTAGDFRHP